MPQEPISAPPSLDAEQRAAISRSLAEPRRFAILQQIAAQGSLVCGALCVHGELSPATVSHHLKELQQAGLIRAEREGRAMRLTFRPEIWSAYLEELQSLSRL